MLETIGTYATWAGILLLAVWAATTAWPWIKTKLPAGTPTGVTAAASAAVDLADEAQALALLGVLALKFKQRGDAESVTACSALWAKVVTWSK